MRAAVLKRGPNPTRPGSAVRTKETKNVSFAFLFSSSPPTAVNRCSCSIANPDIAYDAFAVGRDHDASLDIAVGSVAVRGRCDHDPAAEIAVVVVVVVVMMMVGVERMVMMMVVMVI